MKKSASTKKKLDTKITYSCEYCKRQFALEKTMYTHMCEHKRRWEDRNKPASRVAYHAWTKFCETLSPTKVPRTYIDFVKNCYYSYFIKYAEYCINIKAFASPLYFDWLLKNRIKVTEWATDSVYTRFLLVYLKSENHLDALYRSIETLRELSTDTNINDNDYLKWGNSNKICYNITTGRISPWLLFNSDSGHEFLSKLDQQQLKIIFNYINPAIWDTIFSENPEKVNEVKILLKEGRY